MKNENSLEYIYSAINKSSFNMWEFSPLDKSVLAMVIRGTFIFNKDMDVEILKKGLVDILNLYPHLSGRVQKKDGILINNEGVPFVLVEEPDLFVENIGDIEKPIEFFGHNIKGSKIKKGIDPVMSVKVTKLKNGTVLGVQCSHGAFDGDSFYTMIYNWGKLCQNIEIDRPIVDQSYFPEPEKLTKDETNRKAMSWGWKKFSILSLFTFLYPLITGVLFSRTKGFYFSSKSIKLIKNELSKSSGYPISTNIALSALMTSLNIRLHGHERGSFIKTSIVLNMRERHENFPKTFAGNASTVIESEEFLSETELSNIAKYIYESIEPFRSKPSEHLKDFLSLMLNSIKYKLSRIPFNIVKANSKKPTTVYINNFSSLHIYDVDFGFGSPVQVIPHDLYDPVFIWPANPDKGGFEVYFSGWSCAAIKKLHEDDPWLKEIEGYSK